MKVLSLFDGMACGMLAMQSAGVSVDRYVAFEIDKYAVQTSSHNFPMIEHRGDVFKADFTEFRGFDFLVGGSPCTYWSIAQKNNRETEASGMGWELFCQYVRALREAQPMWFIYENNKSMSNAIRESITETFGFEPICINSALVSAQNRQRLYWVGKRNLDGTYSRVLVEQPEDRGILLRDVLDGMTDKEKARCVIGSIGRTTTREYFIKNQGTMAYMPVKVGEIGNGGQGNRIYSIDGKSVAQAAQSGGLGSNTGLYAIPIEFDGETPTKAISGADGKEYPVYEVKDGQITIKGKRYHIKLADGYYIIRKLTVSECKRLQTVPEWYEFPVSDTQAYKMLGNGWTVLVIAHLINATQSKGETKVDNKALGRLLAAKRMLTRQQYKTLKGQILAGDACGAMRGLEKIANWDAQNKPKKLKVLELFAGTRSIGKAFEMRGHEVFSVEWDKQFENIDLYADIMTVTADDIIKKFGKPDVIWASPDCTTYSVAAISKHRRKEANGNLSPISEYAKFCDNVNDHVVNLIRELNPKYYFIENPVGGLRKMDFMQGLPRHTVTYCQYGERRQKPTDIWTNHPAPQFKPPCKRGMPCHDAAPRGSQTGTQALKNAVEKSKIPVMLCEHIVDICEGGI